MVSATVLLRRELLLDPKYGNHEVSHFQVVLALEYRLTGGLST